MSRAAEFRDAAIALGDDGRVGPRLRSCRAARPECRKRRRRNWRRRRAAASARPSATPWISFGSSPIMVRPAVSKRAGIGVGQADADRGLGGGADLLRRRHRLDPADIGAAGLQALDLLGESLDRLVIGHGAERHEQFAGRADGAGDDHLAAGLVGNAARDLGGSLVELVAPDPARCAASAGGGCRRRNW